MKDYKALYEAQKELIEILSLHWNSWTKEESVKHNELRQKIEALDKEDEKCPICGGELTYRVCVSCTHELCSPLKLKKEEAVSDDTKALLDDIISWEKDLSEYHSLESILRERYLIKKRDGKIPAKD